MTSLSDEQRELLNEPYFGALTAAQLQEIERAFSLHTARAGWRALMHELYSAGTLNDANRAWELGNILMYVQGLDWARIYQHALKDDAGVSYAMLRHQSIMPVLARSDAIVCAVCYLAPCRTICMPCKHPSMCLRCALATLTCAVCNSKIDVVIKTR